jgi:hypothetical protein
MLGTNFNGYKVNYVQFLINTLTKVEVLLINDKLETSFYFKTAEAVIGSFGTLR